MDIRLDNKVVIITGGGSGMGRSSSLKFAEAGAHVAVADIRLDAAQSVAGEIKDLGGDAIAVQVDVSNSEDVQKMITTTTAKYGGLDVMFNHAGISPNGIITETSEDDWERCMAIDLRSVFLGTKYAIPEMQKRGGGVILNTAGTLGIRPCPGKASYGAAKAGVINLTRSTALDYGSDKIRCVAICPGFIDTPLNEGMDVEMLDSFLKRYQPMPGVIPAGDVASLAVFLASDVAAFITGVALPIDAGQMAGLY
jgi:NAD(P)-dependent dehydrogenase (short-subunit alcohol dehydrogenase family)